MGASREYSNVLCQQDEQWSLVMDNNQAIHCTKNFSDIKGLDKHMAWYGGASKSQHNDWWVDFARDEASAANLEHYISF